LPASANYPELAGFFMELSCMSNGNDGFAFGVFFCRDNAMMFKSIGFPSWWIVMDEDFAGLAVNDE